MSEDNKYLTNSETNEMVVDIKIKGTKDKLISKINSLKDNLEYVLDMMDKNPEYKPNSLGIVQFDGQEIDNLCGRLGGLQEMKDVISGKSEIFRIKN